MDEEKAYLIALSKIPGVGSGSLHKLLKAFGTARQAYQASSSDLQRLNFPSSLQEQWPQLQQIDPQQEWEKVKKSGVQLLTLSDDGYPALLREIYHPPQLLYVRGRHEFNVSLSLAVVGTRKLTTYGRQAAYRLVHDLAQEGLTIVSGLALGLDTVIHQATVEARGSAVAVLGSGVDEIYPRSNCHLADQIMRQGALVSEFPLGTRPRPVHFPIRNRIISGMSVGTLVIEAGETSGALITAAFAVEQNRDVFAVPGNITSKPSVGTNRLIQKGAKLVADAQDVLEELNLEMTRRQVEARQVIPQSPDEAYILGLLEQEPRHIDDLVRASGRSAAEISAILTVMEIKGMVRSLGGGIYGIL